MIVILQLPLQIVCDNDVTEPFLALCMLLQKLAYPARGADMELMFGWERTRFSRITNSLAAFIYDKWKHLMYFDAHRLTPEKLKQYAAAVAAKGAPLDII